MRERMRERMRDKRDKRDKREKGEKRDKREKGEKRDKREMLTHLEVPFDQAQAQTLLVLAQPAEHLFDRRLPVLLPRDKVASAADADVQPSMLLALLHAKGQFGP